LRWWNSPASNRINHLFAGIGRPHRHQLAWKRIGLSTGPRKRVNSIRPLINETLAARVLTGDSPLELVKTSGSSHCGEHSAAVRMEASNPCINETDKVNKLHRSVRKASQTLSVAPSAVSHALGSLGQSIGDEIFIPTESDMQPTRRALELASAVRKGLEKLESALTGKESVPAEAARTFRIGATDHACMVILPSLVKRLAKSAPLFSPCSASCPLRNARRQVKNSQTPAEFVSLS
jgi:hypothetical protein